MAKFKDIYQQELSKIKEQCEAFSKAHPNVAPMLEQNATDPDVERLLEGFAYLSAQIQEVIDDDDEGATASLASRAPRRKTQARGQFKFFSILFHSC